MVRGMTKKGLEATLMPDEEVIAVIDQRHVELQPKKVVFTNRRIIVIDKYFIFGKSIKEFPYEKIEKIFLKSGLIGGFVYVREEDGTEVRIPFTKRFSIVPIRDALVELLNKYYAIERVTVDYSKFLIWEWLTIEKPPEAVVRGRLPVGVVNQYAPSQEVHEKRSKVIVIDPRENPFVTLERLREMRDRGEITEEEYRELKQKIFDMITSD